MSQIRLDADKCSLEHCGDCAYFLRREGEKATCRRGLWVGSDSIFEEDPACPDFKLSSPRVQCCVCGVVTNFGRVNTEDLCKNDQGWEIDVFNGSGVCYHCQQEDKT